MSDSTIPSVSDLFQTAQDEGTLSGKAMQALTVVDVGAQVQNALGIPAADVQSAEVTLVTMMPDDSGSIRFVPGNTEAVRAGHNEVLDALGEAGQKDSILVCTLYLNGTLLFPYSPLDQAVRMDQHNFDPNRSTPLYDQTVALLGTVVAKTQELADVGVPVRTVTLIVSDGADTSSRHQTPTSVRAIVEDMLRAEQHIIAAMGIDDGGMTDFQTVFRDMGIPDNWIMTPGRTPKEIRAAFALFSQSSVQASQNATSFSETAQGGWTN